MKDEIKLHIGCGKRDFGKDWIGIDGENYAHVKSNDVINLPFENNSVSIIYAAHLLEYFDRAEALEVLKKWYTKLSPGGTIRIAVPDFNAMATMYVIKGWNLKYFLGPLYGKMKMGDKTIYHKTVYDFDNLSELLEQAGFINVKLYDWRKVEPFTIDATFDDQSRAYLPHLDFEKGTLISLNVEATKPQ